MKYNTHSLPNGLRIIHLPSSSKVVYCGYGIAAGSRDERPGEEGIAHFCEHASFKGTVRRRSWHILNCLERVGGELNAFTNKEDTVFYSAILKDNLPKAVDLLSDIVFNSTYPQTELDKEIQVVCDEIESYNDSPAELIYDEFENLLFEGHPLGHNILGSAVQLQTYRRDHLLEFTRRYYHPANAVFFAYGDCDFPWLVRMVEKRIEAVRTGQLPPLKNEDQGVCRGVKMTPPTGISLQNEAEGKRVVRKMNTHQSHVMMGRRAYSIHDNRRIALYLLNNILGGPGMNARLNLSLRERHGLVYSVDSSMVSYSDTGMWSVYFGCDPHDVERCIRLVRHELRRMADHPLTEGQLNAARRQIKGQIAVACDNRESFALDFAKSYLHYGWEKDVNHLFARLDALTPEVLYDVARDIFNEDKLLTLVIE